MRLEAGFRDRRRRVLRAEAAVAVCAVLGLGGVAAARQLAPALFEAATALFVLSTFGALGFVWWTARRHWRCPACDARWRTQESLASFAWNHCAACGTPLLAHPAQQEPERRAALEFELAGSMGGSWRARFEARRRRARWASAAALAVGGVGLVCIQPYGLGEDVLRALGAGLGAIVVGTHLWGSRCPRCTRGAIGEGHHCQRCGLALEPEDEREEPGLARP
jgi:hypothetical protein